ncbi:MAG: NAD(P)-dependent oxidoreductase [Acidobacteriota bacterium]
MIIAIGTSSFGQVDRSPLELLAAAGAIIRPNPFGRRLTEDEVVAHLKGVDGLLAGLEPLNRRVLSAVPQLKAIARVGIGMTNVDVVAASELGIRVSNTPGGPSAAVAEMTLCAALALLRGLVAADAALHRREWSKGIGLGLLDLPVLVIGYGRIGCRVAALFRAFGARVLVHDPAVDAAVLQPQEEAVSLADGLRQARLITLHAGGDSEIIGAAEFELLQPDTFLLNAARSGLVNQPALLAAVDSGLLAGVWSDVFSEEPYSGPLCDCPRALLTPHSSTYTVQCRSAMETEAVRNLLRDLESATGPAEHRSK